MKVAQHPACRHLNYGRQPLAPESAEFVALAVANGDTEARQKPVEDEFRLDQKCINVVRRDGIFQARCHGQHGRQPLLVQGEQHVDRGLVALFHRQGRIAAHDRLVAEILED